MEEPVLLAEACPTGIDGFPVAGNWQWKTLRVRQLPTEGNPPAALVSPPPVPRLKNPHYPLVYIAQVWCSHVDQASISIAMVWGCITKLAIDTVWKEKPSTDSVRKGHFAFVGDVLAYASVLPYGIGIGQKSIKMRLEGRKA
ncbi:hypothetical protein [Mastigocladopsis repens]|uniref:hypothetical protein n=1 Tax=Mastigocladopsis repens TaxID=221287 RepID=UPI000373F75F|nr:hypothetical protein [Mastigocladopsis repens]